MLARARDNVGWPSVALLVLLALTPLFITDVSRQGIVIQAMIFAVGAVGLDLLTGYSGQFSFGQFVYYAVGAYVMTAIQLHAHWSWFPALIVAVLASAVVAAIVGGMFVRLRFFGSAVGTFFLGAVAVDLISGRRLAHWTGGSNGLGVPPVTIGNTSLTAGNGLYFTALIALAISVLFCLRYTKVRAGLAARVVKENEVVAAVMGIRVFREKVRAQAIAGGLAGLGGCVLALEIGYLSPETFGVTQSIEMFAIVAVGGTGSLAGPIIGALFFYGATNGLSSASGSSSQMVFALILLAVVVLFNGGLYDLFERLFRRCWRFVRPGRRDGARAAKSVVTSPAAESISSPAVLESLASSDSGSVSVSVSKVRQQPGETLLKVEDAGVEFGGVAALKGVSFDVRRSEIHAIIGPNGAGKTTLLNCISGIQLMSGSVTLAGQDLSHLSVSERRAQGIARTFQHPSMVADLSVAQNVQIGAYERQSGSLLFELLGLSGSRKLRRVARQRAIRALDRLAFPKHRWSALAGDLAMGEQKHVDIARAIASEPQLLLLDEPTAGLGAEEIAAVAGAIQAVRDAGVTVLVIAHHVGFIRQIADRCTVLDFGEVLTSGATEDVLVDERVVEVFVGTGAKA